MERVYCEFKYSRASFAFLALAVGGTLALVILVPFPDAARAVLFAAVIASAARAHRGLSRVVAMQLDSGRAIAVRDASGEWRAGVLRDGSYVAPWLTIIRWRPEGARLDRVLLLLPDMAPPEARRAIRVILKWS